MGQGAVGDEDGRTGADVESDHRSVSGLEVSEDGLEFGE